MPNHIPAVIRESQVRPAQSPDIIVLPPHVRKDAVPRVRRKGLKEINEPRGLKAIEDPIEVHGQHVVEGGIGFVYEVQDLIPNEGEPLRPRRNRIGLSIQRKDMGLRLGGVRGQKLLRGVRGAVLGDHDGGTCP